MREFILDLTSVGSNPSQEPDVYGAHPTSGEHVGFVESAARIAMENLLLDYAGKVIRVKVTEVRMPPLPPFI